MERVTVLAPRFFCVCLNTYFNCQIWELFDLNVDVEIHEEEFVGCFCIATYDDRYH